MPEPTGDPVDDPRFVPCPTAGCSLEFGHAGRCNSME